MARYTTALRGTMHGQAIHEASPVAPTDWTPKGSANRHVRWMHAYQVTAQIAGIDLSHAAPADIPCPICGRAFDPWSEGEVDRLRGEDSRYEAGNIWLTCWQCNWGRGAMQAFGFHGFPESHTLGLLTIKVRRAADAIGYVPAAGDAKKVYGLRPRATGEQIATRKRGTDRLGAWQASCQSAGWL